MASELIDRFQQFKSRRISPSQGMGEETQTNPSSGTSGVGAMVGATAGGLAASRLNPLATEAVAASGAAVGDLAEVALQQAIDPSREVSVGGMMKSAGKEAALSLVGGGVGRGVAGAFGKTKQFVADKFARTAPVTSPEAQIAIDFLDDRAKARGIPALTPAESSETTWIDLADNISKNSILGAGTYRKFITTREGILDDVAKEYAAMFGQVSRDPASLGDMFVAITKNNKALSLVPAKHLRNEVEARVAELGLMANVRSLRNYSKGVLDDIEVTGGLAAKQQGKKQASAVERATRPKSDLLEDTGIVNAQGKSVFSANVDGQKLTGTEKELSAILSNIPETMPVSDLMKLRTSMLDELDGIRKNKKLRTAPVVRHLGAQLKLINSAIDDGLRQPGSDPSLIAAWKLQNKWFREGNNQFGNKLANELILMAEKNPAGLVNGIMKSDKQNGFRLVKQAKKMLVPDNIKSVDGLPVSVSATPWRKVQVGMAKSLVDESFDEVNKTYSGAKLLNKLHDVGRATLSEALGPNTAKNFFDFAETLAVIQKKNPIGVGSLGIQFVQIGALMSLPRKFTGEAVTVLLGPAQLAKIMTSRDGVKMLREGITLERTSGKWPALMGRIAALASGEVGERDVPKRPQQTSQRQDPLVSELLRGPAITQ